ncbi:sulfotransferase 1 family member D1-like [Ptychodera flava]|uniref:sulfotransferase 1 family member D1-like n=1 Tax=Ptychodera flava TaxID=63121 RepID=UPI00396A7669
MSQGGQQRPKSSITYKGVRFPWQAPLHCLQAMESFEVRPDDIWLLTYTKSGTTWIGDIVNKILVNSGLREKEDPNIDHAPYAEYHLYSKPNFQLLAEAPSPRVITSHLLPQFLPPQIFVKKPKIISVARNPKDIVTSSAYHYQIIEAQEDYSSLQNIMDAIMSGKIIFGEWHTHVLYWWNKREDDNVLFLKYEDMKTDLESSIKKVCEFLGCRLDTQTLKKISEETTIDATRKRDMKPKDARLIAYNIDPAMSPFVRKGVVGDWKNHFTVAQSEEFDKWCAEVLKHRGLTFQYEA